MASKTTKDRPADSVQLAELLKYARRSIVLGPLRLDMEQTPCKPCYSCDHKTLCLQRREWFLWAPCETPWQNDLIQIAKILEETMTEEIRLHERLVEARERAGLTSAQLAARLNLPPIIITAFENGSKRPTQVTLMALSVGLELTPEQLLDGVILDNDMRRRYSGILALEPIEYSGTFDLIVRVTVEGDDRAAIAKALKASLTKARRTITKLEAWEEIPAEIAIGEEAA